MAKDRNKAELEGLTSLFRDNEAVYCSPSYDEANTRVDFIDKMFELLGWDVRNLQGYSEDYRDVVREDKVVIAGKPKAPDYSFRVGGSRVFFVEAKKPQVHIKDAAEAAFQVRRYAYTAKLPLSILTNFREFAVYDTRIKPTSGDAASAARVFYCGYADYAAKWEYLESIFSKASVLKGSFSQYVAENKGKKGSSDIDKEFLGLISLWREDLAKNLALRNKDLDLVQLNYAVQKLIDRMIFLRIAEDRGTEDYESLRKAAGASEAYWKLGSLFAAANQKYNSDLFRIDDWLNKLAVDDAVLKSIVSSMYYPDCPYEFSVMPIETLGNIYEQFLGKTIRLTEGHRAKIEEKPEVRKAGGVFYTPQYIVDYIVRETLGPLVEGKKPEDVAAIKVLDPACGSGSFLIGAYSYLLDYCLRWYLAEANIKKALKSGAIYEYGENHYHLSIGEKQRILLGCIHGVDIDPQAVEVTKLSLLLKLMEHEETESAGQLFRSSDFRFLPNLSANVKCGNSLIGTDYYAGRDLSLFGDEEMQRINTFDWRKSFPVIIDGGGFDAGIGNPPYVRQELVGNKDYFASTYKTYHGTADLYVFFIERGLGLLREGGRFGIIVANKWMRANYGAALRTWMKSTRIDEIVDFGDLRVFESATAYPCILRLAKGNPKPRFTAVNVESLDFDDLGKYVAKHKFEVAIDDLDDAGWNLVDERSAALIRRLFATGITLGAYCNKQLYYGIKTGLNEAFIIDAETRDRMIAEDKNSADVLKPFLMGRDVRRYEYPSSDKYLICFQKGWTNKNCPSGKGKWPWLQQRYPAITRYMAPFEDAAKNRADQGDYWWELRACDYYPDFENPKIVVPAIVDHASFSLDTSGYYSNDKTSIIASRDLYLLGILNSSVSSYLLKKIASSKQGGFFEQKPMYIEKLPIPSCPTDRITPLVEQMLESKKTLASTRTDRERSVIEQKIELLDQRIDMEVYKLYSLSPEEIALVEGTD